MDQYKGTDEFTQGNTRKKELKGSQLHLRSYINEYCEELNQELFSHSLSLLAFTTGERKITWKSPLLTDNFKEYRDDFLSVYYEDEHSRQLSKQIIRNHWPKNGPVWDGLGIVEGINSKGLLLVEAKAHTNETLSMMKATSNQSISLITKTITETHRQFNSTEPITPWLNNYYQLANRLAYLYLLNHKLQIPTWLIQVNFIGDNSHIETDKEKWIAHYQKVFHTLGISYSAPLLSQLEILYLPAK